MSLVDAPGGGSISKPPTHGRAAINFSAGTLSDESLER